VVSPGELLAAIAEQAGLKGQGKIMPMSMATEQVAQWRAQGLSIGVTNGCFDLLHPGHIASITAAKQQCDRLIIGLNSDVSVAQLKGPSRPVQHELARATVLAALSDVDGVVVFGEERPMELLTALKPDVYCKGADYAGKQIPEFELIAAQGGRVELIPLQPGFSTTSTLAKLGVAS
jgi:D-beta-D-heptose 7-phosphate kinase / D-beta-D-heptose 1-phosphate adenosyltransferase